MSMNPLCAAVLQGDTKQLKKLIKRGADVNEKVSYSDVEATPLSLALGSEHAAMVKILIKAGADVNMKLKSGENHVTHLEYAIVSEKMELVKEIVRAGADVNEKISIKEGVYAYPLHDVVVSGGSLKNKISLIKFFIENGANPNLKSQDDMTAREFSEFLGQKDLVPILEEAERSFESQNTSVEEEYYALQDVRVESMEVYLAGDKEEILFIEE